MLHEHTPVAILGAGLSGMSAAHHLREAGVEHRIFERLTYPGGHVVTLEDSGFRFDRTGHLLHLRDEEMRKLALGWIGDDYVTVQRRSAVWSNGVYTRYPFQANTYGLPPQVAYECLMGFIRTRLEPSTAEPTNFEEFCLKHFGEGISKHFMIPYNSRLWGVHPREITAAWCSRFVPTPRLEDVVAGAVGLQGPELGYNTEFVYPRLGIGQLSQGMADSLPHIELARDASSIDLKRREIFFYDGSTVGFGALISTMPLDKLCSLLTDAPEAVKLAASKLRCNPLQYLDVALDVPAGQPHHWVYVPEERYPFYRVGCYSHFSADLAPAGKACLYIELVDRKEPDLAILMPQVAQGLIEMGYIQRADQIAFVRKRRLDYAYVIFDHAYFESVDTIHTFLQEHQVLAVGRYGGWNYSSMEDALLFGRQAALNAAELVR